MNIYKKLPKFDDDSYVHFVTARTYLNYPFFSDEKIAKIFLEELQFYSKELGFTLVGYVIMPDHVHILFWWDKESEPELGISRIMNRIKTMTSKRTKRYLFYDGGIHYVGKLADVGQPTQFRYKLWQPGFYDFNIYSQGKLLEKLDYVHNNPVKAGLVNLPGDYKWSSYALYSSDPGIAK